MGSCVSIGEQDPGSARFRLAVGAAKAGEMLAPPPAMGGVHSGNGLPPAGFDFKSMPEEAGLGLRSTRCGTKDEAFFDSQECFESDCEDDFISVNGDLTPSRGNATPIHHMVAPIKLQQHKAVSDGLAEAKSEPSPRKTLAELLQETMARDAASNEPRIVDGKKDQVKENSEILNKTIMDRLPNSLDDDGDRPYVCTRTGERTADGRNLGDGKERRGKAKHCCLPSLVHSLSFNDKKPPSPWRHSCGGGGYSAEV